MRLFGIIQRRHKSYSSTVLLPKTSFEQRIDPKRRAEHAVKVSSQAGFEHHYSWQLEKNTGEEFILHDGPPYANGKLHLGHAVNKILKDITCRYKALTGHRVHFIPGWDCHGLPIETKAIQKGEKGASSIRPTARKFALEAVAQQMKSFQDWGVMADWGNKIYRTLDTDYVKGQLYAFCELYDKNLVFRDLKPVYWSPSNETALAEAELEYNHEHNSTSVFVRFEINSPHQLPPEVDTLSALVWTTTPWTLLANQAICYSKTLQYAIVKKVGDRQGLIVSLNLLDSLQKVLNCELQFLSNIDMNSLSVGLKYRNPINDGKFGVFLAGDHVTAEKGTGLVHSAPNHGFDDYKNALSHGMPLEPCLVDEKGRYVGNVAYGLAGKEVLTEGTNAVVEILQKKNLLLHKNIFTHSYPYDWRSKKPIIVRSSKQWFIDLSSLREQAIDVLENQVKVIPESAKKMFINQLSVRPHWCISRQRTWGVPIPVVYDQYDNPSVTRTFVEKLCNFAEKDGFDFWFEPDAKSKLGVDGQLGRDIMDIWFDSGISWKTVQNGKQADLYLEGGDQIRGWFQSSLLTSVALTGRAPYKALFLHGFTLDENGFKMSKSLGNVVNPEDITGGKKSYGIDVLRWWVASHAATSENIPVKPNILEECAFEISKLRNTYKFILGNTENFHDLVEYEQLEGLDKAFLHSLYELEVRLKNDFESMNYSRVCSQVMSFVVNEVSSVYVHAVKNRLYCFSKDSQQRRSACTALKHLGYSLIRHTSPILPHLSSEVLQQLNLTLHKDDLPSVSGNWNNQEVAETFETLEKCRQLLNKHAGTAAKSQVVTLYLKTLQVLEAFEVFQDESWSRNSSITDLLQCCKVVLVVSKIMPSDSIPVTPDVHLKYEQSNESQCPRCRRVVSDKPNTLCELCSIVLGEIGKNEHLRNRANT